MKQRVLSFPSFPNSHTPSPRFQFQFRFGFYLGFTLVISLFYFLDSFLPFFLLIPSLSIYLISTQPNMSRTTRGQASTSNNHNNNDINSGGAGDEGDDSGVQRRVLRSRYLAVKNLISGTPTLLSIPYLHLHLFVFPLFLIHYYYLIILFCSSYR